MLIKKQQRGIIKKNSKPFSVSYCEGDEMKDTWKEPDGKRRNMYICNDKYMGRMFVVENIK